MTTNTLQVELKSAGIPKETCIQIIFGFFEILQLRLIELAWLNRTNVIVENERKSALLALQTGSIKLSVFERKVFERK